MFAEWETQKGIVLIYPHIFCDFQDNLEHVQDCYDKIIIEILKVEEVYLIVHPRDIVSKNRVDKVLDICPNAQRCKVFMIETNDVWARDSIALSIKKYGDNQSFNNTIRAMSKSDVSQSKNLNLSNIFQNTAGNFTREFANFGFNGWGLKYPANLDNQLNKELQKMGLFDNMKSYGIILEGGSIDYNGKGVLLTNTQCLLEKNRNPHLLQNEIEIILQSCLNVSEILWLHHGFLLGDDTDGHIDTLARFLAPNTIAYIQCTDATNPHFNELNAMQAELESLAVSHGFTLIPLPFCEYTLQHNTQGKLQKEHLPASYANFLFLNEKRLLVPVYNKPTDSIALATLRQYLPDYTIIDINCESLIRQHGSLHCISMQIHK